MKKIIIMGIPAHNNIGDAAIVDAEIKFLRNNFRGYEIKLYSEENFEQVAINAKNDINDEDIIFIHGGGNIGNLYKWIEYGRRKVIQTYPNNTIISFPQTTYFENNDDGKNELEISKKIYNNHKNLILLARETKSFEIMKKHFVNARIYLTPDIVMTEKYIKNIERKNVLLLLRNDIEKKIEKNHVDKIRKILKDKTGNIIVSDTIANTGINNLNDMIRQKIIINKIKQCQKAKIVITDRLHGVIFSVITQTPCIILNNFNYKLEESYNTWLKALNYIKLCDNIDHFEELLKNLQNMKVDEYNNTEKENIILEVLKKENII